MRADFLSQSGPGSGLKITTKYKYSPDDLPCLEWNVAELELERRISPLFFATQPENSLRNPSDFIDIFSERGYHATTVDKRKREIRSR